ncbi:mercuric reductase [Pedobacter sp. GR22-6]|uniref:mercuric reductase n=1 Tax=Pedobacter sp. GR22-6 TaxID=3127957 RepID=UPI00307E280E
MKHYDAIVIGAGQAGTPLAKKLAESGKKTAIIEKRMVGGTCINDGCTPTKAMIASARIAFQARKAAELGVEVHKVKVNLQQVVKRKDEIVKSFRESSQRGLEGTKGLDLIFGEAHFSGEKELTVVSADGTQEILTADWIFINTGAKTIIPDIDGIQSIDYLTSTSILDLVDVPEHLLVLGGNYIGLEFGQMYSRFGSKVTVLEQSSRLLGKEDEDISEEVKKFLQEEDIEILTRAKTKQFDLDDKGAIIASVEVDGISRKIRASHVLIAVGRSPQTAQLELESTGVKTDEKGYILVNPTLETNISGIYALGDVKGGPAFTHIAYNDYTIVYRNLLKNSNYSIEERPVPYCMFTDPQLGRIGLSEQQAKAKGLNIKVAVLPMTQVARGIETGETKGMMKAVVDADTKQILGAAILAADGGEIVTVLQMAMQGNITHEQIRFGVFAHPTYAESLNNLFMKIED